jgi:SNF2 family DNA or RNA helicase
VKESKKFKDFQYCLFIKCSFDIDIVSKFRKLEFRYFHVNSDCWEIAPIHLQAVKNILINQEYQIIGEELLQNDLGDFTFKTKPYQYQIEGVKYGIDKRHWHLGDEQGLGKTKQIIDLARYLKEMQGVEHCLVICGVASLRWNWRDEIETHSDETYKLLGFRSRKRSNKLYDGGTKAKLEDLQEVPEEFFWIINIEAFREEAIVKLLKKYHENGTIGAIFIDEVHKVKNPLSAQGKGFIKVMNTKNKNDYRVTMSGTPLVNQPMDLFIIFKSLGYEENSYTAFKNHYCIFGGYMDREIVGYRNLQELKTRLKNIQLRRLKEDVLELPQKFPQTVYVDMYKEQEPLYKEVLAGLQDKIDLIMLSPNPLAQFTRLRQVVGTPQLVSSTVQKSAKLDKLVELVDEIASRGEQCLIFSNWAEVVQIIVDILKPYNAMGYLAKNKNLKDTENAFKADNSKVALVGTIKLMGTGLTFNNSNNVIFFDSPWTGADKQQCIDRCHRIGQTNDLNIYSLVCANSIDEKVEMIVRRKELLSQGIVDSGNIIRMQEIINMLLY